MCSVVHMIIVSINDLTTSRKNISAYVVDKISVSLGKLIIKLYSKAHFKKIKVQNCNSCYFSNFYLESN